MPAIFISHASHDRDLAADVMAALARLGFERVFLDFDKTTGIGAGENWEKRLYEELSRCHAVILMLTPAWLASKWCFVELTQARALGKVILPVIGAPLGDGFVLPEIQAVDLLDWRQGGLERLERRLHAISSELARGFTLDPNRPPYPGIHAFEAEDAAIYFGRDDETREVIERLEARRTQGGAPLVVIIGASGSGKSSVLRAGVLPQLGRLRTHWIVLPVMRPERAPLEALAKSIADHLGQAEEWRLWHRRLGSPDAARHLADLASDLRVGDARAATLLLPVDQFEEVFTIAKPEERTTFLALLSDALGPDLPVIVLATARSDVVGGLLEAGELARQSETYPLVPMPLDRVPRVVEGPAAVAGLLIEKGLAEHILHDLESADALPLLAHTLALLYLRGIADKRLTIDEYRSLGDPGRGLNPIQNSVRLVADKAIDCLKPTAREVAALRDAFVPYLVRVRLDDGRRVRQLAHMDELPGDAFRLVRALVEARLLSTRADTTGTAGPEQPGRTLVEVTHEALFKAWPRLDRWLTEEQDFLSDLERIRSAQDIWAQAAPCDRPNALLGGLLLSRARDWLMKYPQRFLSRDMEALRSFIAASAEAADAERAKAMARDARQRRRDRRLLQAAIAAVIVLLAVSGAAIWSYIQAEWSRQEASVERDRAQSEQQRAESERAIAQQERNQALAIQSRFLADLSKDHYSEQDYGTALALALEALPDERRGIVRPYFPAAESMLYRAATALREQRTLQARGLQNAAFSPDGRRIVTGSNDHSARVWDSENGAELAVLEGHTGLVSDAAFSPDGRRIVTVSEDNTARLWDAASGVQQALLSGHLQPPEHASFSPDGTRVVTTARDNSARVWDVATGRQIALLDGHSRRVAHAVFSPDGRRIVTTSGDTTARLWDAASGAGIAVLSGHTDLVFMAAFSPDGRRIVTASQDNTARIWDATDATPRATLDKHSNHVFMAAFSPDGDRIVTASRDGTARIWRADTGEPLNVLDVHGEVSSAVFSPDGRQVLTASWGKSARLWNAADGAAVDALHPHAGMVWSAAFSPGGRQIVTVSDAVRLWRAEPPARTPLSRRDGVKSATFSPDGRRILAVLHDHTILLLDSATGAEIDLPAGAAETARAAAFSPDARRMAIALDDHTARIYDTATGTEIGILAGHAGRIESVAFLGDGSRIATASDDGTARIWDATTGAPAAVLRAFRAPVFSPDATRVVTVERRKLQVWDAARNVELAVFDKHEGEVNTAAFSPDGKRIVSASADRTARVWDAATGAEIIAVSTPEASVATAQFSPDGRRILTASYDGAARIWDAASGQEVAALDSGTQAVSSAAYAPDGQRVVLTCLDGSIQIWPAFPTLRALIDHARSIMPRELTREQRARFFLDLGGLPRPQ